MGEPYADRGSEVKTRANLKLPEVSLCQPHKHSALLPLHPQLVILLQLLSLALVIKRQDQGIAIPWSVQGVCFWEIEAKVEVAKEEEMKGIVDGSWRG